MNNPKKKNQHHKYLELTGIAFQMGITIYLGAYFGKWLDNYFQTSKKQFTLVCTLAALAISIYLVLAQLKKINNKYD